jgi:hypothetical protein
VPHVVCLCVSTSQLPQSASRVGLWVGLRKKAPATEASCGSKTEGGAVTPTTGFTPRVLVTPRGRRPLCRGTREGEHRGSPERLQFVGPVTKVSSLVLSGHNFRRPRAAISLQVCPVVRHRASMASPTRLQAYRVLRARRHSLVATRHSRHVSCGLSQSSFCRSMLLRSCGADIPFAVNPKMRRGPI